MIPVEALIQLADSTSDVEVLWLYGSCAKGNAGAASDIDLAVAFKPVKLENELETRLRPEIMADDWCRALGLPAGRLSIIDINLAPVPLAFEVINANRVLWSRDDGSRQLWEEGRIMSRMEIDIEYYANDQRNACTLAMRSAMKKNRADIAELATILALRPLSGLEYRAAERTLQVSIEACIGIAKHWSKALQGYSSPGVYESFETLAQFQYLTLGTL